MEIRFLQKGDSDKILDSLNNDPKGRMMMNRYSCVDKEIESDYRDPVIVACEGDHILGFLSYSVHQQFSTVVITQGYIVEEYRGRGIYTILYNYMIKNIKCFKNYVIFRETREDNAAIIKMCLDDGYTQYGIKPNQYYNHETDTLMNGLLFHKKMEFLLL